MLKKRHVLTCPVVCDRLPLAQAPVAAHLLAADDLRHQVQSAFSTLDEATRQVWRRRLLNGLARHGVQVGSTLFIIGIAAAGFDDLTPSDLGMLLRYIRINQPAAIKSLAGPLAELLALEQGPALTTSGSREAA